MNIIENLEKYTEYARGEESLKCKLEYEDIDLSNIDFSKYDLNNSFFGGVEFLLCDFSNVYLSGSNFGGSSMKECILNKNIIRKATWDDMILESMKINLMDAFRTSFMYGKFTDIIFNKCFLEKCSFANSELINVYFVECTVIDTDFTECRLEDVHFKGCKMENTKFDEDTDNHTVFFD